MSEARSGTSAPTVLRMILGRRLQDRRLGAGASLEDAARALRVKTLTIRRLEKAEVALKLSTSRSCWRPTARTAGDRRVRRPGGAGQQARLVALLPRRRPDWFTAYVSLESGAKTLRTYEPQYVTGLLQTPDYARAVLRGGLPNGGEEELTRRVELRLRRQNLLEREDAPTLWVVMEEAVLHRAVGSPDVMREQVERLLEFSELPHVSIDIVPFSAGAHSGACAPFTYFRFEEPELPDIVYSELLSAAVYFDQRADVVSHLEAHTRMALMTSSEDSTALLNRMRKEYS